MMKNILLQFVPISFIFISCTEKLKFEKVPLQEAMADVNKFYDDYPDVITNGDQNIPVGNYYTVYAVSFRKDGDELKKYFPDLDFSEIQKKYPSNANGIRIYQGLRDVAVGEKHSEIKLINYVTFTKSSGSTRLDDDIIDLERNQGEVYKVENHQFDLRRFREARDDKPHHLSCAPHCPDISLIK